MPKTIEIIVTDDLWKRIEQMLEKRKDKSVDGLIKQAVEYYWQRKFAGSHDVDEFYKE